VARIAIYIYGDNPISMLVFLYGKNPVRMGCK
jgi:hypothetical protein